MPMKTVGGAGLGVVAGDVLALRGTGLAAPETWALLCQAAQALQDLFLSNGGVVGGGSSKPGGPVVTPHTIELTARGRVNLLQAPPDTARAYLPPEYRPGRLYSDTESEKMWMYSLGRALLDTTPQATALTGTVSVSPSSALQSVLAAMTEPDPRRRASLMNLLDVISEYCRTRLQSRPFTHIVMDLHREVVRSGQYAARKRAMLQPVHSLPVIPIPQQPKLHQQHQQQQPKYVAYGANTVPMRQNPPGQLQQPLPRHPQQHLGTRSHGRAKGMLFKEQSRNSRSQPNLLSMDDQRWRGVKITEAHDGYGYVIDARNLHQRTNSQPECRFERVPTGNEGHTIPQARSSTNLAALAVSTAADPRNPNYPMYYGDPLYSMPVKPFLSSQDVRGSSSSHHNNVPPPAATKTTKTSYQQHQQNLQKAAEGYSKIMARNYCGAEPGLPLQLQQQQDRPVALQTQAKEDLYATSTKRKPIVLQRQHSSPQLFSSSRGGAAPGTTTTTTTSATNSEQQQQPQQQKPSWEFAKSGGGQQQQQVPVSGNTSSLCNDSQQSVDQKNKSLEPPFTPRGPPPPKPPRITNSLKKAQAAQAAQAALEAQIRANEQKELQNNGPRALRGKAVQRAPSRLYRTVNGPAVAFNKTHCVGPEFVVRANQPVKLLTVGDFKMSNIGRLTVILLTGQRVEVTCDPQKITAGELFQAIVQTENIEENFTLGLAALLAGDFAMLPPETKLNKVSPPGWLNSGKNKSLLGLPTSFILYLRIRFFLPSLRGIRSWIAKHLLYLQIRRCILEQQLVCPLAQLINLTGLALQAEFGNYSVNEHGCGDYFLLEHYVPESLILNSEEQQYRHPQLPDSGEALRKRLQQAHRERRGLEANKAEEMFVTHAQSLPDYGAHYYTATTDGKELGKIVAKQKKFADQNQQNQEDEHQQQQQQRQLFIDSENIYDIDKGSDYPIYGKIDFNGSETREQNFQRSPYTDEQKIMLSKSPSSAPPPANLDELYATPKKILDKNNANNNKGSPSKPSKFKKSDSDVWLAIHSQGLKVFERGARLRERLEMANFQWKEIQTLSYGKNCLIVYTKINGKRFKFKLRMDHRKSFYAFKLTSLHHQFYLKLRADLASLQALSDDFGVPLAAEPNSPPTKTGGKQQDSAKTKISIADSVNKQQQQQQQNQQSKQHQQQQQSMRLEEQQNKENENPLKDPTEGETPDPSGRKLDNAAGMDGDNNNGGLYAQVSARLEPEGESRDTEDEADRALTVNRNNALLTAAGSVGGATTTPNANTPLKVLDSVVQQLSSTAAQLQQQQQLQQQRDTDRLYNYANIGIPYADEKEEFVYNIPKPFSSNDIDRLNEQIDERLVDNPEELYAAINKTGLPKKPLPIINNVNEFLVPNDQQWKEIEVQKTLNKVKTASLPNYANRPNGGYNSPGMKRRLEVKTGNRTATYGGSGIVQRNPSVTDDLEILSLKSDSAASIRSVSAKSNTDAYVLNTDIRTNEETFRIPDETMSNSLLARLDELSFAEERMLRTIKLERGHGGSIGLQVTEGNDGGVYVQAVSVGGSADMAGNVNKGDRIVAINGQSLLNLRYEDALKMLQSSSETVELVLSQIVSLSDMEDNLQEPLENHYLQNIRFNISSEAETSGVMSTKWLQKNIDIASVQNTSSAYSSAASSAMGNHNINSLYIPDIDETNALHSASMLLSIEDFDISRTNDQPPSLPPPPVPPRRRRRRRNEEPLRPGTPRRKRASPAPPRPPVPQRCKKTPSPESQCRSLTYPSLDSASGYDTDSSKASGTKYPRKSILSKKSSSRASSPYISKSPEPNEYPPLCFTYQDYQMVMEDSSKNASNNNNIEENGDISLFMENITFNDPREEIYFRITTTSRPFEKCLADWNKNIVDTNDEEPRSDLYIFENYMDRSNKLNARPQLLYTDEYSNDNSASERSTTKVRFLIESPSTSTPDADLDDDGKSYREFIQAQLGKDGERAKLTELTDEQAHKESVSIERESESVSESLQAQNQTADSFSDLEEDKEVQRINAGNNPIDGEEDEEFEEVFERNGVRSSKKQDEPEVKNTLQVPMLKCGNDLGDAEDTEDFEDVFERNGVRSSKIQDEPIQKSPSPESKSQKEASAKTEATTERRQIYIDSSCYKLSNEDNDEWQAYFDKERVSPKLDRMQKLQRILIEPTESVHDDTIDDTPVVNPEETEQVVPKKEVPTIEISQPSELQQEAEEEEKAGAPAGRASRNSFLEKMLDNNSSDASSGVNCEVIATHPKQDQQRRAEEAVPRNSPKIESAKPPGSSPPPPPLPPLQPPTLVINASADNKSAGEARSDMLNELLTNFNSIKLKPVGEPKTDKAAAGDDKEPKADDLKKEDKSAIVKEAPYCEHDNKAMTPVVDVSKDQYKREAVTITPGSVRNLAKYYEIHSEINHIAKIKEDLFQKQKELASSKKKKTSTIEGKKVSRSPTPASSPRPTTPIQPIIKSTLTASPNMERRKSVQFTEPIAKLPPKDDLRPKSLGVKPKPARKPLVSVGSKPDRVGSPPVICIQGSPKGKTQVATNADKPGNRINYLPKNDTTLQSNHPTIVFYCTV